MNLVGRDIQTNKNKPFREESGRAVLRQLVGILPSR